MFDLNRRPILWAIGAPIQIRHVHSSVSYQQATHPKYDQHGLESPSGYGPLGSGILVSYISTAVQTYKSGERDGHG